MKTKFKLFALLLMITVLSAGKTVLAEEKTKEFHESWAASSVESLEITNKFGEVKVVNEGGSEITIDVVVTVEAANENRVNELLDKIDVSIRKSGNTVKAETSIENNFNSQRKFSIDYVINVPSDKNLKISNKYGNTIVNKLTANGDFEIKYGNLTANALEAPASGSMKIELGYGNATIGTANDLTAMVSYSPISIDEVKNLKIETKYSQLSVEKAGVVNSDSKYDKLQFGKIISLTATTKYSHIRIEELSENLKIEAGYGSVKVDKIAKDFESISITNSYGQISLGLNEASYSVDASCDYCGISYPEENFKGNKMKESHTQTIDGKVGNGGGTVMIKSRYGDIKLKN